MRPGRCICVAVVALAVAGCGSDTENAASSPDRKSDRVQIQVVVDSFNRAADDLDATVLCAEVISPSGRGGTVDRCAQRVDPAMAAAPENWGEITELRSVRVNGDTATAAALQDGEKLSLTFLQEDGRWWMQVFD